MRLPDAPATHQSTLRQFADKWREFSTFATLPRIGHPAKITPRAQQAIIKEVKNPNYLDVHKAHFVDRWEKSLTFWQTRTVICLEDKGFGAIVLPQGLDGKMDTECEATTEWCEVGC